MNECSYEAIIVVTTWLLRDDELTQHIEYCFFIDAGVGIAIGGDRVMDGWLTGGL